jgi:hypothetical protein
MAATMTPTMMEGTRLARGALSPGAAPAGAGSSTAVGWASVRGVCIPQLPVGPGEARHAVAPEDPRPERYDRVEIRASALRAIDVIVMRLGGLMRLGGVTLAERGLHAIAKRGSIAKMFPCIAPCRGTDRHLHFRQGTGGGAAVRRGRRLGPCSGSPSADDPHHCVGAPTACTILDQFTISVRNIVAVSARLRMVVCRPAFSMRLAISGSSKIALIRC